MVSLLEHYVPVNGIIFLPHGLFLSIFTEVRHFFGGRKNPLLLGVLHGFFYLLKHWLVCFY